MSGSVLVVGDAAFRRRVAGAIGIPPETVDWVRAGDPIEGIAGDAPSLIAIAPEIDEEQAILYAEKVVTRFPTTALVLVRESSSEGALPRFMRAGFRDVVDLSQGEDELAEALQGAMRWAETLDVARGEKAGIRNGVTVTVFSSKGGSGKSFVASNLATALATRTQRPTAIVDLDVAMGDCFAYFGAEAQQPLGDLIAIGTKTDEASVVGVGVELGPDLRGYATPSDPAGDRMRSDETTNMIRSLQRHFDHVVLDAPADYSDAVLAAFDVSSVIYMVAALDVVGIRHLSKGIETLLTLGVDSDRLRIILNRADSKVGLSPEDVERVMKIKIDALIPSSRLVPTALNKGIPVYLDEPQSSVAIVIGELADGLTGAQSSDGKEAASQRKKFGLFSRKG